MIKYVAMLIQAIKGWIRDFNNDFNNDFAN